MAEKVLQMKKPVGFCAYFDSENAAWSVMAGVLSDSCRRNDLELVSQVIRAPKGGRKAANHSKLGAWASFAQSVDRPTVFLDADILMANPIGSVFDRIRDVGITRRSVPFPPINAGVVFMNPTARARRFMSRWHECDARMIQDRRFHMEWWPRYGGMNQSSLGFMLDADAWRPHVDMLECREHNLCYPWSSPEDAVFVHIKDHLRDVIFQGAEPQNEGVSAASAMYERALRNAEMAAQGCVSV